MRPGQQIVSINRLHAGIILQMRPNEMIVALNAGRYKGRRVIVTDQHMHCWIEAEVLPPGVKWGTSTTPTAPAAPTKPRITAADFVLLRQMGIRW